MKTRQPGWQLVRHIAGDFCLGKCRKATMLVHVQCDAATAVSAMLGNEDDLDAPPIEGPSRC